MLDASQNILQIPKPGRLTQFHERVRLGRVR
jgi:hypothetical protein